MHQYKRRQLAFDNMVMELVAEAEALRRQHPGCGVEKMYHILKPRFMGRDKFIEVMMSLGFRLKQPRNYRRTTFAGPVSYPNLIKGMDIDRPGIVWQSDITYLPMGDRFYYAVFIIDVYSKKIVGHSVSKTMQATANIEALKQAFKAHQAPVVHHSDRGGQYGSKPYTRLLKDNGTAISMGLKAQDNAYAERINRTIKEEYLYHWTAKSYEDMVRYIKKAVKHYNQQRPHNHLNKMTPVDFEKYCLTDPNFNRPRITIFDDNKI